MRLLRAVVLSSIMFSGITLAQSNDGGAEARFHAKFGRNSPIQETRERAAKQVQAQQPSGPEQKCCGDGHGCCKGCC